MFDGTVLVKENILSFPTFTILILHFLVLAVLCSLTAKVKKTFNFEDHIKTDSTNRKSRIGTTVSYCWITQFLHFLVIFFSVMQVFKLFLKICRFR